MIKTELPLAGVDTDVAYRLRLIRGDALHDDLAVALGLLAAGLCDLPERAGPELDRAVIDRVLDAAGEHRAVMYDAWYRLKIPFGDADLGSWYILALAFGRTSGDLSAAVDLHADLLQRLETEDPENVFTELGLSGPIRDGNERVFMTAVLEKAPFWCAEPRPWRANLRRRALAVWSGMREEERPTLLLEFKERMEALEQVRFFVGGELVSNRQVGAVLLGCARSDPGTWSDSALGVVTAVLLWREAGFCIQELNQSIISLPLVVDFVVRRLRSYEELLGEAPASLPDRPAELGRLYARLRCAVELGHLRCLQFDGSNWERREFLVPRPACTELVPLPAGLRRELEVAFDAPIVGEGPKAWARAVDNAVAAGRTPTDVIKTLGRWAAEDSALPVDYAIFTAPMSAAKLDAPWTLNYEDVFCYTAFSDQFDWRAEGVPFDFVRIANAIGQRLRYNVVKKAQNYTLVRRFKAQSFNLPDIAVAEDANHEGHRAAGIRMSCRVPTYVHHEGITWKGLADIRLNRTFYREHQEFRPSDVPLANRLAEWLGWIADAVYERNLQFDAKYGKKLTELEEHR